MSTGKSYNDQHDKQKQKYPYGYAGNIAAIQPVNRGKKDFLSCHINTVGDRKYSSKYKDYGKNRHKNAQCLICNFADKIFHVNETYYTIKFLIKIVVDDVCLC